MSKLSLVLWNVRWRRAASEYGRELHRRIMACSLDIVVLTEAFADGFDGIGHTVTSTEDYGYPLIRGRRKVVLWSREPWTAVLDGTGSPTMPPGRYVEGETTVRELRVHAHGVCVPWRDAHVNGGRRDAVPWGEHLAYLSALGDRLRNADKNAVPTIVAGDFNQHLPRRTVPKRVYEPLRQAIDGLNPVTAGQQQSPDGDSPIHLIDHVLLGPSLRCEELRLLSARGTDRLLSDHPGVVVALSANTPLRGG